MKNPFLDRKFTLVYAIVWLIIMIAQALAMIFFFEHDIISSIIQSIITSSSFALCGYGIWVVVKYNLNVENRFKSMLVVAISGVLIVLIWMAFNYVIENIIFKLSMGTIEFHRKHFFQFVVGIFLFSIFAMSYRMMILTQSYADKAASEEKLRSALTETKLSALKAYVNPHFLFNSLNSVNALITIEPEKAREMLVNLSEYFRYSLKQKDNTFISFKDELHYTFTYFEIEKLRFADRIKINTEIDEDAHSIDVPVMILQPLFENIIKHAVSESLGMITIDFKAKIEGGFLRISLLNNYDEDSIVNKGTGIGLSTTAERLALLYDKKDLFSYSRNDGNFKLWLDVPIKK